ncbi:MAG: oligosaccharide flippase family protein, partial [Patescibacteria group bacterium]
ARLLQPELFGIYSLAIGMAGMTSLILGMGIQEAVSSLLGRAYVRRDRIEVEKILGFMLKITFLAALAVILVSAFLPGIADRLYGNSLIGVYAAVVVVASIFSSFLFVLVYSSFQVTGRVKLLGLLILSDQSLRYVLSLIFILVGFGVPGAVSGQLAGAIIIFIVSAFLFNNLIKKELIFPGLFRLIAVAREINLKNYFGFTFWVALDRNMGNVFMALPVILTGIYVSASDVSFFKLAFGYMNIILSLLGPISVLLNVEFPKMQIENKGYLYKSFKRISLYSLALSTMLSIGAVIVSSLVFKILYGESYLPSIKYVFGLILYGSLFGIGVGLGPMWRSIDKVKVSIIINSLILAGGIPLGLWLIKNYGLWGSVITVTIWFSASHLVSFVYLVRNLKTKI